MLIKKIRETYLTPPGDFKSMCADLLRRIPADQRILKMVFYGNPADAKEYDVQVRILEETFGAISGAGTPPLSYIAQKPLEGGLLLEVCRVDDQPLQSVSYRQLSGLNYVTIENPYCRELITGGAGQAGTGTGTFEDAAILFEKLGSVLRAEDMPVESIVRQWNYLGNITDIKKERQVYQEFNRARSRFYQLGNWTNGYPAATGIGVRTGGLIVNIEAIRTFSTGIRNITVNNSLQVPAHQYSGEVLAGADRSLCAPKFERARLLGSSHRSYLFVSGTAAIRGEESMAGGAAEQTRITMENIQELTHPYQATSVIESFIVYLKREADYPAVKRYLNTNHPEIVPIFLVADLCREELLVEIEAIYRNVW